MENKVSIITPSYNCEKYISYTIDSVLKQTHTNWELLIIDDCSTDNTATIVKSYYVDERIKFIKLDANSGAAIARNKGTELATGDYIAFLDSDDIWKQNKLELQLAFMEKNAFNITCTGYEQLNENGESLNKIFMPKEKVDYNGVLLSCPVGNSTVMYNVNKMGKYFVPNIRKRNDDALWLKILKNEKYIYGIPNVLMSYRVRSDSISSNKLSLVKYHWILYREIEKLSIPRSIFHICVWGIIKVFKLK